MSLINRDAITRAHIIEYLGSRFADCAQDIVDLLDDQPTVDAEPVVHAHWIDTGNSFEDGQCRYNYWECSHCHRQIAGRYGLPDYCPNCGARMDEVV